MDSSDSSKIPIIGVVGKSNTSDDRLLATARQLGKLIAEETCVVLTGGHHKLDELSVKKYALLGAMDIQDRSVGLLGIPPKDFTHRLQIVPYTVEQSCESNYCWVYPHTNLDSEGRNPLNGQTPDVLIALSGAGGTAQEIEEAMKAERPVVFLNSWSTLKRHIVPGFHSLASFHAASPSEAVDKALQLVKTNGIRPASGFPLAYPLLPDGFGAKVQAAVAWLKASL
jgi:predicted Rossmann-fold nucleotide-binding protein